MGPGDPFDQNGVSGRDYRKPEHSRTTDSTLCALFFSGLANACQGERKRGEPVGDTKLAMHLKGALHVDVPEKGYI